MNTALLREALAMTDPKLKAEEAAEHERAHTAMNS